MPAPPLDLHIATPEEVLSGASDSLADTLDALLECGVVVRGELWLSVADVDLVFLGLDLVLANPDTMQRAREKAV